MERYQPVPLPNEYDSQYLLSELQRIANAMNALADGELSVVHVEPPKPFNGMIRYADGTDWDPGSGEGFYGYENGAWVKL